ncbi:MAG: M23 family metallopeptidase [Cyclobacteriaceae bacterium]
MGDPLKDMSDITPTPGNTDVNTGRYGCTRRDKRKTCGGVRGKRFHDGLDISAHNGTYVFSAFEGKVVAVESSFEINAYGWRSYGNYVTIESINDSGGQFRIKYNHLDKVFVSLGAIVGPGYLLGQSGTTGNASDQNRKKDELRVTPHVHIQTSIRVNGSWYSKNPEEILNSSYNSNGTMTSNPCVN